MAMEVRLSRSTMFELGIHVPVYRDLRVDLAPAENDPQPELVAQLAQEMYSSDMLQLLVSNMWRFEFEVSILSPL
jgi:hypothetical protein